MARKINLQLEDDVVMIAMTIITDDGEDKGTYSVEQRLYTCLLYTSPSPRD